MDATELKAKQRAAIERMLNLNGAAPTSSLSSDHWSDQWKVLVYDRAGRDIISPLLNVAQLRRNGVTLHMLVSQLGHEPHGMFAGVELVHPPHTYSPVRLAFQAPRLAGCQSHALLAVASPCSWIPSGNPFQTFQLFTSASPPQRIFNASQRIAGVAAGAVLFRGFLWLGDSLCSFPFVWHPFAWQSNKLYAAVHLNFISKLERFLMEDLARLVIEAGSVQTIAKV